MLKEEFCTGIQHRNSQVGDLEWAQAASKALDKLSATIKNTVLAEIWKELISADLNDKQRELVELVQASPPCPIETLLR